MCHNGRHVKSRKIWQLDVLGSTGFRFVLELLASFRILLIYCVSLMLRWARASHSHTAASRGRESSRRAHSSINLCLQKRLCTARLSLVS